jgi:four helix bundle protein
VWQRAHEFVLLTYRYSDRFPKAEIYGLTSQLRRAAISVAANIAEGFKKRGRGDKVRFLNISQGSLEECRYYLLLAKDLGYGETSPLEQKLTEVSKLLESYMRAICNSNGENQRPSKRVVLNSEF